MKHVLVTSDYFENEPYIKLDDIDDLIEYSGMISDATSESIARALQSGIDPEHYYTHMLNAENHGDGVLITSYRDCVINGGNPLFKSSDHLSEKLRTIGKYVLKGEIVLINKKGGFCTYIEDSDWIITDVEAPAPPVNVFIDENPSLINLENDPDLEDRTKEYFEENELELSYIKRLRKYDMKELISIFKDFKEKGGYGLYVYTTGMDTKQMHDYCNAALNAKLTDIVFEFSAGYDDPQRIVVDNFKGLINIKVLNE